MKKLLTLLALVSLAVNIQAASLARVIVPNGTAVLTNIINGPADILSLEITSGGNANFLFGFVDSPNTNSTLGPPQGYTLTTYSNGAVVTFGQYTTNIAWLVTNASGLVRTQTRAGVFTYPITNGATTSSFPVIAIAQSGTTAGGIINIPIDGVLRVNRGLTWTNGHALNTNITINVIYEPAL